MIKTLESSELEPCQHKEADPRHDMCCRLCKACAQCSVAIRTVDRDVVALSVAVAAELDNKQLWVIKYLVRWISIIVVQT